MRLPRKGPCGILDRGPGAGAGPGKGTDVKRTPDGTLRYDRAKFTAPQVLDTHIGREALCGALRDPAPPVTLVVAGPGYGKTTLVREILTRSGGPAVWLTADARDNPGLRFWGALVTAFQTYDEAIGERVLRTLSGTGGRLEEPADPPDAESLVFSLLADLESLEEPLTLVIEDYHTITSERVHRDLYTFIQNMPAPLRLLLTTRSDPPFPVARMKLAGRLAEIRQDQLRFGLEETVRYFGGLPGICGDRDLLERIHARAEGWPVALQVYRIALEQAGDPAEVAARIAGSGGFVLDYLQEEVLASLSGEVQRFLWSTALLGEFTEELAAEVTGKDEVPVILARLQQDHLFLETFVCRDRRTWYRYHQLFRELLVRMARRSPPGETGEVFRRAAGWYSRHGMPLQAVEYAVQAGEDGLLTGILEDNIEAIFWEGRIHEFLDLSEGIPDRLFGGSPRLASFLAFGLLLEGKTGQAGQVLGMHAPGEPAADGDGACGILPGVWHTVQSALSVGRGDTSGRLRHAEAALACLPQDSVLALSLAHLNAGNAQKYGGCPGEAYEHFRQGFALSRTANVPFVTVSLGYKMMSLLYHRGDLLEAEGVGSDLLEFIYDRGLEHSGSRVWVESLRLHILTEFARTGEAEELAGQLEAMEPRIRDVTALGLLYLALLHTFDAEGQTGRAQAVLERFARLDRNHQLNVLIRGQIPLWRARIQLHQAPLRATRRDGLLRELRTARESLQGFYDEDHLLLEGILLGERDGAPAGIRVLEELAARNRARGATLKLAQTLVETARLCRQDGQERPAAVLLEEARVLAEEHRYLRLLERIRAVTGGDGPAPDPGGAPDALNAREIEILACIGRGMTNREIAETLYIAVSTVKWHTTNIYGKLGVQNRTQAVNRGREQNRIP